MVPTVESVQVESEGEPIGQKEEKKKGLVERIGEDLKERYGKIKNVFSRKIYVKAPSYAPLLAAFNAVKTERFASEIFYTPNPL